MISFDVLLVILAAAKLGNHIKERKELKMKPNSSISMIVRLHIVCFVLQVPLPLIQYVLKVLIKF
jgi:hypothetical protein